ncbi:hypothetical protein OS493_010589 [Desmophyllum pertusum]|uniref:CCHC-type domain-containing protein n=1 Tax=Desmophyllum pertusum TaxID=174260 RepID=A0A9W9ZQY2_9CNID|nr:hypothetical protein OS493_010589 [Desmophyllum pertusum]
MCDTETFYRQEPLFYRRKAKILEGSDPLEDVNKLFEQPSVEEQHDKKILSSSVTIVDILDDDVEADKKRIRERCLPVDSPLLFISDDICKSSPKMSHPVGGTGEVAEILEDTLQDIDMVNHQGVNVESSSCEIFDMFCRKFCKRRCVTFLAVDGLNFKNEEQSSAIRQMLRCLDKQGVKNVKATDKCFKCGEEGHWANKCKKDIPHDQAWLLKQQCYTCGQYGHLKKDCKIVKSTVTKCKQYGNKTAPKVKETNNNDPLTIQLLRLPEVDLTGHVKLEVDLPSCDDTGKHLDERFLEQGSEA